MEIVFFVVLLVVCILFSAFFSGAEIALSSLDKITVKRLKRQHGKRGRRLEALFKNPSRWLITILIGNNLANIAAVSLATLLVSRLLTGAMGITLGVVTGIMTFIILIFGEITPKKYCQQGAPDIALKIAGTILFLSVIFSPIVKTLSFLAGGILKTVRVKTPKSDLVTEKDIHTLIVIGQEEGALDKKEEELVHSALEFDDKKVREVMTDRTKMVCIEQNSSLEDLRKIIKDSDYSRIPVYHQQRDKIVGVVHIKDLFGADKSKHGVKEIMRSPIFVPYATPLSVVLKELKKERTHLAIVVDEYGGVGGIVTMEDLLEEIVGEIEDEYDEHKHNGEEIKIQKDGSAIVSAEADIDEVNEKLGIFLPENADVYESVGGFIESQLGKIPQKGESIEHSGVRIDILESDEKRIKKVRITKRKKVSTGK